MWASGEQESPPPGGVSSVARPGGRFQVASHSGARGRFLREQNNSRFAEGGWTHGGTHVPLAPLAWLL
jgi:hypothetical protein